MTSFMINAFVDRKLPDQWIDEECTFCKIIMRKIPAFIIYENDEVIAFLDTLPIRPGHTLIVPKAHFARLTDLPLELSRAMGEGITRIGDAITKGMENPNMNVVCNQGYAQAVHHVHFHLVPAPIYGSATPSAPTPAPAPTTDRPPSPEAIFKMERDNREELDDEDAVIIVEKIRSKL